MKVNKNISVEECLAEITSYCQDREYKQNSRGWYIGRIRDAMREMSIDSMYFKATVDLEMTESLRIEIPEDFFFPELIFVFNKATCCSPDDFKYVYWKKNFNNKGSTTVTTSRIKSGSRDNVYNQDKDDFGHVGNALYCNEQNGMYVFSPSCAGYTHVRMEGHSLGGTINDTMVIPVIFKKYVVAYVVESYYKIKAAENPRVMRTIWRDFSEDLDMAEIEATNRVKRMTPHEKATLFEFTSSPHK